MPLAIIIIKMLFAICSSDFSEALKDRIRCLRSFLDDGCMPGLLISTAFSGTDLIIPALSLFFMMWNAWTSAKR